MNHDTTDHPEPYTLEDEAAVRLLRAAGPRPSASRAREARVRAAVHHQWHRATRRRIVRRRTLAGSIVVAATGAFLMAVPGTFWTRGPSSPPGNDVATVDRVEGDLQSRSEAASPDRKLIPGARVREGDWIDTSTHARVALRYADGTSVRLDARTRVRVVSPAKLEMSSGTVYVDTERQSAFEVHTPLGVVRDIGTQFEVRLENRAIRLRVRSGVAELHDGVRAISSRAGTEVTVSARGAESRPIAPYGSDWAWTVTVAPKPPFEGVSVANFLERWAREHGCALDYADPVLAREASAIMLHGSVDGLHPNDALSVAMVASGFRHRLSDGKLVVLRAAD